MIVAENLTHLRDERGKEGIDCLMPRMGEGGDLEANYDSEIAATS